MLYGWTNLSFPNNDERSLVVLIQWYNIIAFSSTNIVIPNRNSPIVITKHNNQVDDAIHGVQ